MRNAIFHIDTKALTNHVKRLEEMNRVDFPIVTRQTLTSAAFRVKTETMPEEAHIFTQRKSTFLKASSKATAAQGLDIDAMKSSVGFIPKENDKSHSVEDLEEQEEGGEIANRSFIPLSGARAGGVWQGFTKTSNRRKGSEIGNRRVFDSKNAPGANDKQKFIKSAVEAQKVGGIVIGNRVNSKGNKVAWSIKKEPFGAAKVRMVMSFNKKFVQAQLFSVKAGREAKIKPTHFMRKASNDSQKLMERDFMKFAEVRMAKQMK